MKIGSRFPLSGGVYGILEINSDGKIDEAFSKESMTLFVNSMVTLDEVAGIEDAFSAQRKFYRQQYRDKILWKPSAELEQKIFSKALNP